MRQRIPKRFAGLARKRATGCVGNRAGDHDRQSKAVGIVVAFYCKKRGLSIQRIEDGFN